jgi:hypothetical protein
MREGGACRQSCFSFVAGGPLCKRVDNEEARHRLPPTPTPRDHGPGRYPGHERAGRGVRGAPALAGRGAPPTPRQPHARARIGRAAAAAVPPPPRCSPAPALFPRPLPSHAPTPTLTGTPRSQPGPAQRRARAGRRAGRAAGGAPGRETCCCRQGRPRGRTPRSGSSPPAWRASRPASRGGGRGKRTLWTGQGTVSGVEGCGVEGKRGGDGGGATTTIGSSGEGERGRERRGRREQRKTWHTPPPSFPCSHPLPPCPYLSLFTRCTCPGRCPGRPGRTPAARRR